MIIFIIFPLFLLRLSIFLLFFTFQIQYSYMPDPYTYLNLFVGLPFNYRKSVLAEFSVLQEHRLEELICKNPALEVHDFFGFDGFLSHLNFVFYSNFIFAIIRLIFLLLSLDIFFLYFNFFILIFFTYFIFLGVRIFSRY